MIIENLPRVRVRLTSERVSPGHFRISRDGAFLGTVKRLTSNEWHVKAGDVPPYSGFTAPSFVGAVLRLARFSLWTGNPQDCGDGWRMQRVNTSGGWYTLMTKDSTRMVFMDYPAALSTHPKPHTVACAKMVVATLTRPGKSTND